MKKILLFTIAVLAVIALSYSSPVQDFVMKDKVFHAFINAAERMDLALENYPNDEYAVMFACSDTQSPILCTVGEGGEIHISYFRNLGSGEREIANVTFKIESKPHLVRGVTNFHN